ncbi:MAG TPA: trigger factor [Thermoanaerobaculia bacterium]|nr:trigger factor [Thermoanaerobaculia bacterium]
MSVVVAIEDVGPCKKQLKVEVPALAVAAEMERVVREYGRRVKIPGFRPGKVPQDVVRRRYQKDIDQEVVERLLPKYWQEAQAESAIDPLAPPEVEEVQDLTPGSPLTFVASVETRPQIQLRNTQDFDLPNPPVDPGTMEIDDTIEDLRKQVAEWIPVERPAAQGDRVEVEVFETRHDGTEGPAQPVAIEIGDKQVWEEMSLALTGLSAGQETTFTHQVEGHAGESGEPAAPHEHRFRVKVQEVRERDLPPLDDAFAAKVNPEWKAFDELRNAVVSRLRSNKENERREQRHKALLDQLRERHPLELPAGVVRQEVEHLVRDYAESMARQGIDPQRAGLDWEQVGQEMAPLAERRVHSRLLLDAIAEADAVTLSEPEFEAALALLARAQNTSTSQLRRSLEENGRLASLRAQLRRDKTVRRLLGEDTEAPSANEIGQIGQTGPTEP